MKRLALLITVLVSTALGGAGPAQGAAGSRPFWTEKSAFVEGDHLFVVGIASHARTVEEGRQKAFERGKVEQQQKLEALSQELAAQIQARERIVAILKVEEGRLKQQQLDVDQLAQRIQRRIAEQNRLIDKHIRCGMTKQEVLNILGQPSGHDSLHLYYGDAALNFGAGNVLQSIARKGNPLRPPCP